MAEICKTVKSQMGGLKLNVRGFLMVKERNRDDLFYWHCEKLKKNPLKCPGRCSTILIEGQHHLRNFTEHNHSPEASKTIVLETVAKLKETAKTSKDKPAQIIQDTVTQMPESSQAYMPSKDALRQRIKRARKDNYSPEPQTLEELSIPSSLKITLFGDQFLIRESSVGEEKVLLFTTLHDVRRLAEAQFWVMDGTFKTVPTIFHQFYSIHAKVGGTENSRILPFAYALMSSKSEACYSRLFQDLSDFAGENSIDLKPNYIISDFEKAAINASQNEFGSNNKCCFFHLSQSTWRKVQGLGLATLYGTDENFSLMVRHIPALAFLPD